LRKTQRGGPKGGVRAAAKELGIDKDAARRVAKVAALAPEAKEVAREVALDVNRTALLEAAKHEIAEAQVVALRARAARPPSKFPKDDHERSVNWRRKFKRLSNAITIVGG
jgi:ParB family chromosome partitioning protein